MAKVSTAMMHCQLSLSMATGCGGAGGQITTGNNPSVSNSTRCSAAISIPLLPAPRTRGEVQPNTPINLINLIKDPATARIVVCIQINPAPCTHPQPMQRHTPPYIFKFNYAHVTCCIFIINLSNSSLVYFLSQSTCLNKSTCLTQSLKRKSLPEPSALTLGTFVVSWRWLQRGISSASLLHHTTVAT